MSKRNHFKRFQELYSDIRVKTILYKQKHPDKVIAGMFLILLLSVAVLLMSKISHKDTYAGSIHSFSNKIQVPKDSLKRPSKPIASEIMDILSIYGRTRAINPDSITTKDSLLLKEIDKDLNKILDEKD